MKKINAALFVIIIFIVTFSASDSMASPHTRNPLLSPTPPVSIPFLINEYYQDLRDLNLVYIFPHHPEYFSRFRKLNNEWMDKLNAVDFNALDVSGRVDFILLKRNIQNDEYDLEQDEKDYQQYSYALPFADEIVTLQQNRRRGQRPGSMAIAKAFYDIQMEIAKAK